MNAIQKLFYLKNKKILNIYFTAGSPSIESTPTIVKILQNHGVDLIEIGLPYSDPLADGNIIQNSNYRAMVNGMTTWQVFTQLKKIKKEISTPIIIMGYYNQFFRFGPKKILQQCVELGISGIILPDLPPDIYQIKYMSLFERYGILIIFLVTPQTHPKRIHKLSKLSKGFLYIVSSNSTTGQHNCVVDKSFYFKKIKKLSLNIPKLIGFGIYDRYNFELACKYAEGAIIGSAFIKALDEQRLEKSAAAFIRSILDI